jgi:hypothetical protein
LTQKSSLTSSWDNAGARPICCTTSSSPSADHTTSSAVSRVSSSESSSSTRQKNLDPTACRAGERGADAPAACAGSDRAAPSLIAPSIDLDGWNDDRGHRSAPYMDTRQTMVDTTKEKPRHRGGIHPEACDVRPFGPCSCRVARPRLHQMTLPW